MRRGRRTEGFLMNFRVARSSIRPSEGERECERNNSAEDS